VIKSATINGLETIKKRFELNKKRDFTTLQGLHEVQASIKRGEKSPWYYHWVNLAIRSAKRHVTNTEDIINAAVRGNAHIALVKQVGPATFAIYEAEPHQADRICKEGPNQAPVVQRVTIRPNTLVTVPSGCLMVPSTFTFSPVATSFIRDRKDYLIDYNWPDSYKSIIGELDTYALPELQNNTGGQ
jgi:hypothetical protein